MKIIADENIPHVTEAFSALGNVTTLPGRTLKNSDLLDCECLLVRSVTPVNAALLENTPVKFVASATIGTDHIDLDYLAQQGIGFANAPGCNAESASEYVINTLFELSKRRGFDPFSLTAGIVGHGNVGSRVKKKLDILGIQTLVNDPPKQEAGDDSANYVSLQTILHECDFITLHVPLTREGAHPTWHLFNQQHLEELLPSTVLFNAARGAVIDNPALSDVLRQRDDLTVFLDTWENEPGINQTLLKQVDYATPHIAGYSVEGKLRGTQMILDAACDYFELSSSWSMQDYLPEKQAITLPRLTESDFFPALFNLHYRVEQDHQRLIALAGLSETDFSREFDLLRKNYPARYEYSHYSIETQALDTKRVETLKALLFCLRAE